VTGAAFGGYRRLAAIAVVAVLAACGKPSPPASSLSGGGAVGYVRMEELVQKHPLYDQLARYDRSIEAFDLSSTVPRVAANDPEMRARERDLEKQLDDAANRTKTLIDAKQKQYQQQEAAAINAALQGAGNGPSAAQIAGSVNSTARQQQGGATRQAQSDFASYRRTIEKQDQAQITAAQKALTERADRTWRAKAEELQSKESALSLKLANDDAAQRLALRTKLSSLALDDAAREDAQKQLAALDRKEADVTAAEHNRDQQTLAALQTQLHDQVQGELNAQVAKIRARSLALMQQRQQTLSRQVSAVGGPVVQTGTIGVPRQGQNLPPALRARIEQLHLDYQKRFQNDAKTTIAEFQKTRADLSRRYAELHGIDASARQGAQAQVLALRKKREDLYGEITGQIDREVRLIAQQRGISVVLSDVVAPAGGVDLTPDALKDIESLHE
jgi:hypothetical protein